MFIGICFAYTSTMRGEEPPIPDLLQFEWDEGNSAKSWARHGVRPSECEEVFGQQPLLLAEDLSHSQSEPRFLALGKTFAGRRLLVVFTVRLRRLRVISARDMSRKERSAYEAARDDVGPSQ